MSGLASHRFLRRGARFGGLLLLMGLLAGVAQACPSCQVGIGGETVKTTLAGYVWSYCFLALCPFFVVGSVVGSFHYMLQEEAPAA